METHGGGREMNAKVIEIIKDYEFTSKNGDTYNCIYIKLKGAKGTYDFRVFPSSPAYAVLKRVNTGDMIDAQLKKQGQYWQLVGAKRSSADGASRERTDKAPKDSPRASENRYLPDDHPEKAQRIGLSVAVNCGASVAAGYAQRADVDIEDIELVFARMFILAKKALEGVDVFGENIANTVTPDLDEQGEVPEDDDDEEAPF